MAAPTHVGSGTAVSGTGAITVGIPSHATDDICILFVNSSNQAVATPAGWNLIGQSGTGTAGTANAVRCTAFWKRVPVEGVLPVSVGDSGDHTLGIVAVFRGCATSGDPWEGIELWTDTSGPSVSIGGAWPTGAERLIVSGIAGGQEATYSSFITSGSPAVSSVTQGGSGVTTSGVDGSITYCYGPTSATSGYVNIGQCTASISTSYAGVGFALKPVQVLSVPVKWVMPVAATGVAYSWQIQTVGGSPTSCSITSGALPTGFSISNSGLISGTCSTPGTYTFTVLVTDGVTPTSFTATIKVRTPTLADKVVVSRYVGTGASITVNLGLCDLSTGGLVFIFDDLETGATGSPTAWIAMSANGSTVAHTEYAPLPPAYSTSGVTFANGSVTLPAAMSAQGRTFVVLAIPAVDGICDVVSWSGTGATTNTGISLAASGAAAFTICSVSQGVGGVHTGLGFSRQWLPQGWQNTTSAITEASSTNLQVDSTLSVAGRTYYGAVIANLNDVVVASSYIGNGSSTGPVIDTSGCSAKALFIAGNANIAADGNRFWTRARAPSQSFDGSTNVKARYSTSTTVAVEGSWPLLDLGSPVNSLRVATADQWLNAWDGSNGGLYGTLVFIDETPSIATGALTATLADATVSASGTVKVNGTASNTLAGATVAAAGNARIVGGLTGTLAAATCSATGTAPVVGTLSKTLDAATFAAAGSVGVTVSVGELNATLGAATVSSAGSARAAGTLSVTLGSATTSSTGNSRVAGTLNATLASATCTAAGNARIAGQASNTLGAATLAASAQVLSVATGTLAVTLGNVTSTAAGSAPAVGAITTTLASASLVATGIAPATGSTVRALDAATATAAGNARVAGTVTATLGAATLASSGTAKVQGALSVALDATAITAAGTLPVQAQATIALADAIATAQGNARITATATATLEPATLAATGAAESGITASASITLEDATAAIAGTVRVQGEVTVNLADAACEALGIARARATLDGALDGAVVQADGIAFTYTNGALVALLANASLLGVGIVIASPRRRPIPMGFERPTPETVEAVQAESDVQIVEQERTGAFGALRPRTPVVQ